MCSQCRSPKHTRHTVHIPKFFIKTRHWDQRCEVWQVWSSSNSDKLHNAKSSFRKYAIFFFFLSILWWWNVR